MQSGRTDGTSGIVLRCWEVFEERLGESPHENLSGMNVSCVGNFSVCFPGHRPDDGHVTGSIRHHVQ